MKMGSALALEEERVLDQSDLEGVDDLIRYLEGPNSFGLDQMPQNLRNMILYVLELQGYDYGYMQHQVIGFGHDSLIMDGLVPNLKKKRQQAEDYWIRLYKMLAELEASFEAIFIEVSSRIVRAKHDITSQVEAIDAQIAASASTTAQAEAMKESHPHRGILKWLKRRLEKHEADLAEADTAVEAIQIHQKMEQDLEDVKTGNVSPNRAASRPSPLVRISDFVKRRVGDLPEEEADLDLHQDSEEKKGSGSGGKGKGGRGGSDDQGSMGDSEDELPPPPAPPVGD